MEIDISDVDYCYWNEWITIYLFYDKWIPI